MSTPNAYESMSKEELVELLTSKFPEGAKGYREADADDAGSFVAFELTGHPRFLVGFAKEWDSSDMTLCVTYGDGCEEWINFARPATLQEIRDAGFKIPEA
jgi:hypothetical protein